MIFRLHKSLLAIFLLIILVSVDAPAQARKLIGFGDSLMAGYGLMARDGFMPQLQAALRARGHDIHLINASVSGDTTASGRARLAWTLDGITQAGDIVILELGGNDALRGMSPSRTYDNLAAMIEMLQARHLVVLLAGMRAPLNWGADYARQFDNLYSRLAIQYKIPLYPFFLEGVATVPHLNLADGIHPNATGIKTIVERILPFIENLLDS